MNIVLLKNLNYIHFLFTVHPATMKILVKTELLLTGKKQGIREKNEIPCWLCNGLDYLKLFDPCGGRVKKCLV